MDLTEQLNDYMNGLLPKSLEELYESSQQLDKTAQTNITEYQHNPDETKMKTQNEVNEGLQKVAQHIFTVSTHLNNLLSLQEQQVEKLDLEIRSALARIKGAHIRVGQAGLQKLYKERIPIEGEKTHKLPEDQIPTEYKQKTLINLKGCHLNFSALDEIGTSLTNPNQETSLIKTKNKSEKPIQEAILKSSEKKEEEKTETETETETGESLTSQTGDEMQSKSQKISGHTPKTSLTIENTAILPPTPPPFDGPPPPPIDGPKPPPMEGPTPPPFDNIPPPLGDIPPPLGDIPPPFGDDIPPPFGDDILLLLVMIFLLLLVIINCLFLFFPFAFFFSSNFQYFFLLFKIQKNNFH
ncbi:abelson interacting protein isoform d [Anaeramoeba ignava]|uniref:Abelson interacting protein isoform d n=1 Tax=Anaeramoeba ignava TaxID=1746090 RepID=A0A9Q0LVX2_ANAIG|nr:abelson interacting protein isoform d [Anaeramoeba ignava]